MRKKVFMYYLLLVVLGLSITGFFTSKLAQSFYKYEVEEKLKNTAILISYQLSEKLSSGQALDYNRLARVYSSLLNDSSSLPSSDEKISTRITFIDFKGNVLGESQTDFKAMENHLSRNEVQQAITGKFGRDIRHSKTLGIDFIYMAIPVSNTEVIVRAAVPLMQLKNIDRLMLYYTLAGMIAGLLLTSLLALKFSHSMINPINELIWASKEISNGNYQKRLDIHAKDELGQLSQTFNEMADKLDKTVADLIDKNLQFDSIINSMINGIIAVDSKYRIILINTMACEMFGADMQQNVIGMNIIELVRNNQINTFIKQAIEQNMSSANEIIIGPPEDKVLRIYTNPIKSTHISDQDKYAISGGIIFIQDITNVKKLEQIRTEFVSNVTHELKTPLTSIRGFVETLRSGAINDPDVSEKFLEIIDIEAERLYMLINDILQLSEIETNQKDTNLARHNLRPIIAEVLSILEGVAEKKSIRLIADIYGNVSIIANRDRIKQMLINLIDNAIKYNVESGTVTVKCFKAEGKVVISVKDTGIGIAQEHLSRIFERFYRVDKGRSRNMGGTGLGLSIVKHIVNLYSGDIRVNSEPGKGTEFVIQIPV
ncbi:two-component system phosphate regulon sensor histidine kinase PhoR [Anaerobacterium chartisolvens]|uniref:histidine kinase n=1 Tax=Anaerobacterium chartisolvens TaxID=1297424 RepID=A0A369BAF6_9FIRM|nr:HAMP domain-containing sensor histidine kinase [Anaerobacterium chartisolvens]RCX17546.1 two-component system phosphate regulon sensor histidine kinase PhoR [Anaerobacterium chartisolvens]